MITLHRLGHKLEPFQLNPDHIATVEATPDTVITLTNGVKIVVGETPQRVSPSSRPTASRSWRIPWPPAAAARAARPGRHPAPRACIWPTRARLNPDFRSGAPLKVSRRKPMY